MPGKVLYIEDNPMNTRLIAVILRRTNYVFLNAESGPEGIKMAQDYLPDLILLDINMPDMDGIEVCRRLRALPQFSKTSIIAVTAWVTEDERESYIRKGFDDFLPKPVNRFVLLRMIDERIGHLNESVKDDTGEFASQS
ncbi:response regulator [Phototrophicus methaneseepsis]|uniref:Response regulator n=1 Tax=Phototrophicus methaneseepsis TaxID=2710758 RepID=A0A7S8IGG0_9CHLR|nr:response regulator [Phototrophicus methaneseepsis]QPC84721.1 response regulator [Phototrophicus methaneseepsis]